MILHYLLHVWNYLDERESEAWWPLKLVNHYTVLSVTISSFIVCQSWLWADLGLPGVCVCLCVFTGIELWIYCYMK